MAYAQTNYSDQLGNGPYTIAQAGCLLTAFSNLLDRYGNGINPATLNSFFKQHETYLISPEDGANVYDDLTWNSITQYDPSVIVDKTGVGAPTTDNTIVKFIYKSPRTGDDVTHFCLVADSSAHTIIDSWDGQVKNWSVYGEPVVWANYLRETKGDTVVLTSDDVTNMYQTILGRAPDAGGLANYTGKTLAFALSDMLSSDEYKSRIAGDYNAQIASLQATIATLNNELANRPTETSATPEQVAGGTLIEALKEALK